jgi:beta-glucosidase
VLSERALREIYLKGFEIAVKEADRVLIMTSYNPINGYWAASNYDLVTTIVRRDWGFDSLVMTDWWTSLNLVRGTEWTKDYLQAMVRAGNDVYMVCKDAEAKSVSVLRGIKDGYITRGELQDCVRRMLEWIMETPTYESYVQRGCTPRYPLTVDTNDLDQIVAYLGNVESDTPYEVAVQKGKNALISFSIVCKAEDIAQNTVVFRMDNNEIILTVNGESKDIQVINRQIAIPVDTCRTFTVTYPDCITMPTMVIKQ